MIFFSNRSQKDIPVGLKGELPRNIHAIESPADKYKANLQAADCDQTVHDHNMELGYLNTTIRWVEGTNVY